MAKQIGTISPLARAASASTGVSRVRRTVRLPVGSNPSYAVGETLPGTKYVVVRKLGQGGMGSVFEVVKSPGIRSVVKIIHPWLAADRELRRQFFDEVAILAKLDHPNIVKVTDYDELANGTPYFAMELLTGSTVQRALRAKGVIHPPHLYEIMRGLLEGLDYAHTHTPPIAHRDVKSANVFIHTPAFGDPCVKVIDFGLACGVTAAEAQGRFVGTRRYAAPEQIRGERVTFKADLYSAGLLLYEGLAGRGPFDDTPMMESDGGDRMNAIVRAHLSIEAPSVTTFAPWVPERIDELLRSALAKDPEKRPPSAQAFASEIFVLQWWTDTSGTETSTVLNLSTLAELASVSDDSPGSSARYAVQSVDLHEGPPSAPTTRRLGTGSTVDDTAVDSVLLLEVLEEEEEPATMRLGEVATEEHEATEVHEIAFEPPPEPHLLAPTGRPRSFADVEREVMQARSVVIRESVLVFTPEMPLDSATQTLDESALDERGDWDGAAVGRGEETRRLHRPDDVEKAPWFGLGRLPVIALAVAIPFLVAALATLVFIRPIPRAPSVAGSEPSGSRVTSAARGPIILISPEDPPLEALTPTAAPTPPAGTPDTGTVSRSRPSSVPRP